MARTNQCIVESGQCKTTGSLDSKFERTSSDNENGLLAKVLS